MNGLGKLLDFLSQLESAEVHYVLEYTSPGSLTVLATVHQERWQVKFFVDGKVDVEVFRLAGKEVESSLARLFERLG